MYWLGKGVNQLTAAFCFVARMRALTGELTFWSMLMLTENGALTHTGEKVTSTTLMVTVAVAVLAGLRLSLAVTPNWKNDKIFLTLNSSMNHGP